ncbi:hypothetical protein [Allokutzneria sp. NRRL B-24872]|uniref:hypothetical protein n=1 Tax=Allokutzneria sp. NRRL B-24872 TaxID=1137961 RepID=UPI0011776DCD|nr:hypothetical protein [Allokutzneria sp. NRRL B-24872]
MHVYHEQVATPASTRTTTGSAVAQLNQSILFKELPGLVREEFIKLARHLDHLGNPAAVTALKDTASRVATEMTAKQRQRGSSAPARPRTR